MSVGIKIVENPERQMSMHPKKFALWLFMITVVMIFASLTSAYIVKKGDGNWRIFDLPQMFYFTSALIIVSSATLHMAVRSAKRDLVSGVKTWMIATVLLGIGFLIGQIYSYAELISENVYFTGGNPSESFIYVLTGVHWLHLVSGIIFGGIVLFSTFRYKVHSKSMLQIEMFATYWHFLGALWIYLFVFLMSNHQ